MGALFGLQSILHDTYGYTFFPDHFVKADLDNKLF